MNFFQKWKFWGKPGYATIKSRETKERHLSVKNIIVYSHFRTNIWQKSDSVANGGSKVGYYYQKNIWDRN